jgi:metallo-beta-lactamase family protein
MCEAGRIRHHLRNNIENERNTILFPGFQAQGTLGRKLVDGAKEITLFHETRVVRADVAQVHGFSGHADQADLLSMLDPLAKTTRQVFLVHGEEEQSSALQAKLREARFSNVVVAQPGARAAL